MKALVKTRSAAGAELIDVALPTMGPDDLLIEVLSTAMCGTDNHVYEWSTWAQQRIQPPRIFGHEYCGRVVEVGKNVKGWQVGDLLAAETHIPCELCHQCRTGRQHTCENVKLLGAHIDGAFADYTVLPAICGWKLRPDTPPDLGALYEPMGVAINGLFKDRIGGLVVVVIGCGPIGLFGSMFALAAGARKVICTDVSDYRLQMARRVVPEALVLNPMVDDVQGAVEEATSGRGADVVIELSGSQAGISQAFELLAQNGRVSLVGLPSQPISLPLTEAIIYKEARVFGSTGRMMWDTWYRLDDLLLAGQCDPSQIITHRFKLAQYEEAFALTLSGNAGKVMLVP